MEESQLNKLKDLGFNLFPLKSNSKEPIPGLNWKQFQSEKYQGVYPDTCNIAVICGSISNNIFVVDLDDESIYDDIPDWMKETYTVQTGKGKHLYFHYHGFPPANKKLDDRRFRHIDIKSEGGYVLAEGSYYKPSPKEKADHKYSKENENGFYYKIFKDVPILEIDIPKLKEVLETMGFNMERINLEDLKKGVAEGGRDDATFKIACYYVREGLFGEALRYEVEKMNANNKPPLPQKDIDRIISQASKYEVKHTERHIKEAQKIREELKDNEPVKLKMQQIDPKIHEDIPIIFDCMITAVGARLTYTKEALACCPECGTDMKIKCDEYYRFVLPKCSEHKCRFVMKSKETAYIQQLMIEEFLEDAKNSSPIVFDAEITDANIGEAFMGQRKTLTAKFRSIPDGHGRNVIVFDILKMEDMEQNVGCMPTPEEVESWKNCPNFFDRVTASIVPEILMDTNIIQTAILWGTGGIGLNGKRSNWHMANIGDAQLGKSELALRMKKLLVGCGMTVGGKTSGAGLTIGMVKTHNGMMIPRAGFFPQYTGHNCIIDEGDKMGQVDQDSCLEVMEQETATLTKVGIPSMTLPASCPLLFLGNPKGGKFNEKFPTIMDNFNMQIPFISRFDIVWVMQDKNDPELDRQIRKFIRSFKSRKDNYMTVDELQRYFVYVKSLPCKVPEELMDKIDELHAKMRPLNQKNGLPIGIRQYHGLYRLITSSAKAHLRTEATIEDFELVEKIIRASLKSMRMNMDTGEVGKLLPEKITKETRFLETWDECKDSDGTVDRAEFVTALSKKEGYVGKINEADMVFGNYLRKGSIILDNDTERHRWVGTNA